MVFMRTKDSSIGRGIFAFLNFISIILVFKV